MFGKLTHLRNQRGFTMAEVVMAALIFTASVVGISGMLISGSANVTRGATETAAINLANRRLEEVKSLSYYIPWDPAKGNQDIDDFYYNTDQANGVTADEGQHPQLDHPRVVEDYGTISGFPKFKRKTAVEYQYVSTLSGANSMEPGGTKHLAPAVMCKNSPYNWVPNSPVTGQTDDPRGGDRDIATDEIHALVVEVSVYYNLDGAERVYKERSLVGALTTSGAYNQPYLLIQSINPTEGEWNDTTFQMTIMVKASTEFNDTANVDVRLWRTGTTDIPADSSSVSADGTRVTSNFNLSNPAIKIGVSYNISVYWKQGGWTDIFRSCFQVVQSPPGITSITTPADSTNPQAWGYAAQTARQVIIKGEHLSNPTSVVLRDPSSSTQISGTVVNVPGTTDSHTIVATFNLASTTATKSISSKYWNVMVTTAGGNDTSSSDISERLLLNPTPTVTDVLTDTFNSPPSYFDWAFASQSARKVRVKGTYLYGLEMDGHDAQHPADNSATVQYSGTQIAQGIFVSALVPGTQTAVALNDFTQLTEVVLEYDFTPFPAAKSVRGAGADGVPCDVRITNYGGPDTQSVGNRVKVNPLPVITRVTPTPVTQGSVKNFDWAHGAQTVRNVRIEGNYLYGLDQPADTSTTLWSTPSYGGDKLANSTYVTALAPGTQTTVSPNNFQVDTQVVMAFNFSAFADAAKSVRDPVAKPNGVPCDIQIVTYGNIGGTPATSGNDGSRVRMNPTPVITSVSGATGAPSDNPSGSPPYFGWAHGAQTARNVQINGQYLYALDQSDTTVQLEYGGNRTTKATFTSPQNPALYDVYPDTPVVMTFNPSSATGVKAASNTMWNVEVTNYGGAVKSNGSAIKQVKMNPPPVIASVAATSSPSYYNWAYLSQTNRNVMVTGNYLYALDQSDGLTKATLKYGTSPTYETATNAGFVSGSPDNVSTSSPQASVVLTFHPSSAAPAPPTSTYNKYWDVRIQNYGGPATYGVGNTTDPTSDTQRVKMNPLPTVSNIKVYNTSTSAYDAFSTAKTGTASDTNYKTGEVYQNVAINGTYLQPGSSINMSRNTFTPTTGTTYVPLAGGTVAADGTSVTGLTMGVDVNPMNTSSFMQWPGSTLQSDNTLIGGTYHLIFVNADTTKAAQDLTLTVSHATFTVTASSKQSSWGSVSPTSASYYQDQSATVTATPGASATGQYQFVAWQSAGADFSTDNPVTFTDSANHTIQARFRKKLYWSTDGVASANWGVFMTGYNSGTGTTFTALNTVEDPVNPSMYIYASGGFNREIAGVTTSTVNLTGASKIYIDWKQVNAANSYLVVSSNKTSGYNTYNKRLAYTSTAFARRVESLDVTSYQSSYYIRVHSRTPGSVTNTSTIRVYRVWLE